MLTIKPVATLSWNTESFLITTLERLVKNDVLDFWAFIKHFKESDEKKDHYHVYMIPSKRIDTKQLQNEFDEFDIDKQAMIKVANCDRNSKFDDWYMYTLHDSAYLGSKGQKRKYHYTIDDYKTSNFDEFNEKIHRIDRTKLNAFGVVLDAVARGESFYEIVKTGQIPIQQFNQYQQFYNLMVSGNIETFRNGFKNHDEEIDEYTGEIKSEKDDLPF